jgi:apolipoprotein N-acyltransferase
LIYSFFKKLKSCPSWCCVLLSGILIGLNAPGYHTQLVGMISLFPLFLVMDRVHANCKYTLKQKFGLILVACWGAGSVAALVGVPWLSYAAHTFGQFSWGIALFVTALCYGSEVAIVLFICFAIPTLFIRQRGYWDLLLRLSYFLTVEPFCPRLFHWSFGGMTFTQFPWLSQVADVVGSPGLGLYNIGFSLLLLLIWRLKIEQLSISEKVIRRLIVSYLVLWAIGLTYGVWRIQSLESNANKGAPLDIAAIQPNFSYQQLDSGFMDFPVRLGNLRELLKDSVHALAKFPTDSPHPRLIIWPESTYPGPYLKDIALQSAVKHFASFYQTSVLLHSIDWDETSSGRRFYSVALLIGTDGEVKGRYNKIFRIPFGEYIPAADFFPSYANLVRKHISHLSELEKGREYTVFQLSDELLFSAPICFDVFSPTIVRNMSRSGAKLAVNLSNLIWFGKTTASDHLEMTIRWKAIENRIPVLLVSNNGKSVFINALGENISERLGLFDKGSLSHTVFLKYHFSLYREYTWLVHITFALFLTVAIILGRNSFKIVNCQ